MVDATAYWQHPQRFPSWHLQPRSAVQASTPQPQRLCCESAKPVRWYGVRPLGAFLNDSRRSCFDQEANNFKPEKKRSARPVKRKPAVAVYDMDTSWIEVQKKLKSLGSRILTTYIAMDRKLPVVVSNIQSTAVLFVTSELIEQKLNDDLDCCTVGACSV